MDNKEKSLKELVSESGFTLTHLAENVLYVEPSYLSRCLSGGGRKLSKLREKMLRDYLEKVSQIKATV